MVSIIGNDAFKVMTSTWLAFEATSTLDLIYNRDVLSIVYKACGFHTLCFFQEGAVRALCIYFDFAMFSLIMVFCFFLLKGNFPVYGIIIAVLIGWLPPEWQL